MRMPFVLAVALVAVAPALAEPGSDVAYRGFTVDTSAVASDADRDALVASARTQVDLVLRVGLSDHAIEVLQGFPVHLGRGPGGGHFSREGVFVNLPPQPDPRLILFH